MLQYIFLASVAVLVVGQGCLEGWIQYQDSCYVVGEQPVTWAVAQEICEDHKAKLAEVEDAGENTFLQNIAFNRSVQGLGFWLGATDIFDEGNWEWTSSGSRILAFTDWAPNQPDEYGAAEDCLCLYKDYNYTWNDYRCDNVLNFLCEAEPLTTIE